MQITIRGRRNPDTPSVTIDTVARPGSSVGVRIWWMVVSEARSEKRTVKQEIQLS
jgi:hypothetical protein